MTATMPGSTMGETMTETEEAEITSGSMKKGAMIGITKRILDYFS